MKRTSIFLLVPITFIYAMQPIVDASTQEPAPYSREALIDSINKADKVREKAERELRARANEIYRSRDGVEQNKTVASDSYEVESVEVSEKIDKNEEVAKSENIVTTNAVSIKESIASKTTKIVSSTPKSETKEEKTIEDKKPIVKKSLEVKEQADAPVKVETAVVKEVLKVTIIDENINEEEPVEELQEQRTHYPINLVKIVE